MGGVLKRSGPGEPLDALMGRGREQTGRRARWWQGEWECWGSLTWTGPEGEGRNRGQALREKEGIARSLKIGLSESSQ